MSNLRQFRRRKVDPDRCRNGHELYSSVQMGATADEDLRDFSEVKQRTHDLAIENAGRFRDGGVRWAFHRGEAARDALMAARRAWGDTTDEGVIEGLERWMDEHPRAILVVASCPLRCAECR